VADNRALRFVWVSSLLGVLVEREGRSRLMFGSSFWWAKEWENGWTGD